MRSGRGHSGGMAKQEAPNKATIWCLFSVDNNYDQPDNNLVAWWPEKPTLEVLFDTLGVTLGVRDQDTVAVVKIWAGSREELRQTQYRLELVSEGKLVD